MNPEALRRSMFAAGRSADGGLPEAARPARRSRLAIEPPPRRRADLAVRRLLRIPDGSPAVSGPDVHGAFTASVLVSAARCLLTYVVLPFIAPALGLASGAGPWVGIPLSTVAIAANVVSIRRFWLADHRWRWPYSGVGLSVIALLIVLAVGDVAELVR